MSKPNASENHLMAQPADIKINLLELSDEENKLKNLSLAKVLLHKLSTNNINLVAERLLNIPPEYIVIALFSDVHKTVYKNLPFNMLEDNGVSSCLSFEIFSDIIRDRVEILLSLLKEISLSNKKSINYFKRFMTQFKNRIESMVRKDKPGSLLLWLHVGPQAKLSILPDMEYDNLEDNPSKGNKFDQLSLLGLFFFSLLFIFCLIKYNLFQLNKKTFYY